MKKNAIITINDKEAQVTKAFAKQARIFGTPEYRACIFGQHGSPSPSTLHPILHGILTMSEL